MADNDGLGKWADAASATILLSAAVLGLTYEAAHIFMGEELVKRLGSQELALIFLIALLCGGLGLERLLILRKVWARIGEAAEAMGGLIAGVKTISKTVGEIKGQQTEQFQTVEKAVAEIKGQQIEGFQTVEEAVNRINQAASLIGTKEIEDAALEIIEKSDDDDDINATNQYGPEGLSKKYVKAIADRVKKADEKGGNMEYRVIMPARTDSDDEVEDLRRTVFCEQEIEEKLIERHAKHPYPLEVLIVGHSMIIALRGGGSRPTYDVAIKITDPKFVEKAAR